MKKMLILAMTMAMVLLAAAGVCETLRVGMECNYAPYNWTQSDASENAVAIAAGGYADGYDVRIAKIIADQLGMELEIVKTEWDGLTPALLSGNIDVIIAGMSPTAERRMTFGILSTCFRHRRRWIRCPSKREAQIADKKLFSQINERINEILVFLFQSSCFLSIRCLTGEMKVFLHHVSRSDT